MFNRGVILAAILILVLCPAGWAQRGGGARAGAGGARGSQSTMGQARGPSGERGGLSQEQRQRIRATEPQRSQYRVAAQAANRVRTRARAMVRMAKAAAFSSQEFRPLCSQLQNEIQLMTEEHEEFMAGLTEEQRTATKGRDDEMDKELEELKIWGEAMDEELKQPDPNPKQLSKQARQIEKTVKEYQNDDHQLALDLSIE